MGATKREVAEQLGVAKQTIVNYIAKLDLSDHVERVGKTDVLDEFAVSAIAHAVGKSIPQASAPKEDGVTTSDAVVSMLNERISDLKDERDRLKRELEDERSATSVRSIPCAVNLPRRTGKRLSWPEDLPVSPSVNR